MSEEVEARVRLKSNLIDMDAKRRNEVNRCVQTTMQHDNSPSSMLVVVADDPTFRVIVPPTVLSKICIPHGDQGTNFKGVALLELLAGKDEMLVIRR